MLAASSPGWYGVIVQALVSNEELIQTLNGVSLCTRTIVLLIRVFA